MTGYKDEEPATFEDEFNIHSPNQEGTVDFAREQKRKWVRRSSMVHDTQTTMTCEASMFAYLII